MINSYCEECSKECEFERVQLNETIVIRGTELMVSHEYDKCKNCTELFEPLEDVDKNIKADYIAYRHKMGFMQPEEIKKIREKYKMTVRQFASILGIGFSTISNIENGALHTGYQDTLFRLSTSPSAFYKLIKEKKEFVEENLDDVIETLEIICLHEEPSLTEIKLKYQDKISFIADVSAHSVRRINELEHEVSKLTSYYSFDDSNVEEKSSTWKKTVSNIFLPN